MHLIPNHDPHIWRTERMRCRRAVKSLALHNTDKVVSYKECGVALLIVAGRVLRGRGVEISGAATRDLFVWKSALALFIPTTP